MTVPATFRPPWAVTAWSDGTHVYIELPLTGGGPPYIQREPATPEGLARLLRTMHSLYNPKAPPQKHGARQAADPANHPAIRRPTPKFTDDQRAKAQEVLRRLKLI